MQARPAARSTARSAPRSSGPAAAPEPTTDVCLIVEGCYPFVRGGVSAWVDWLMRGQPHLSFSMISIWPLPTEQAPAYALPPNLVDLRYLHLHQPGARPRISARPAFDGDELAEALQAFVRGGGMAELAKVDAIVNPPSRLWRGRTVEMGDLLNSQEAWKVVQSMYDQAMPRASFVDYFWAWRALFGGLFAILKCDLPPASV